MNKYIHYFQTVNDLNSVYNNDGIIYNGVPDAIVVSGITYTHTSFDETTSLSSYHIFTNDSGNTATYVVMTENPQRFVKNGEVTLSTGGYAQISELIYNNANINEFYSEPWVSFSEEIPTKQIPTQINNAYVGKEDSSHNIYVLSGLINGELNWVSVDGNFDFETTFPPKYTVIVNDNNTVTIQELNYIIQDIKITEIQQDGGIFIMTNKEILFSVESDTDIVYKTVNLPQVNYNKKSEYYIKFTWDGTSYWTDGFTDETDFYNEYKFDSTTMDSTYDFCVLSSDSAYIPYEMRPQKLLIQSYKIPDTNIDKIPVYLNDQLVAYAIFDSVLKIGYNSTYEQTIFTSFIGFETWIQILYDPTMPQKLKYTCSHKVTS